MANQLVKAAINGQKGFSGKFYFFNGKKYIRLDWNRLSPDDGYPKNLSLWKLKGEFASGIDAAINGEQRFKGFGYLFKGSKYQKYDWKKDEPVGNPKSLGLWKLKGDFLQGIDAACNGKGSYKKFGYLFKGNKYMTYDWAKDAPYDNRLRDLKEWKLPKSFLSGIDSALDGVGRFSNYTLFFKGDQFVRYDWKTYKAEGPWPIRQSWKVENRLEYNVDHLFETLKLDGKISFEAFRYGYLGYECLGKDCAIPKVKRTNRKGERELVSYNNSTGYLSIIDFTKPSNEKRLVVLNMHSQQIRNYLHVSHGVNTAGKGKRTNARYFSNTNKSLKSCLGFLVVGWSFPKDRIKDGKVEKRVWVKLHGIEPGINDKAQARGIMMHTANYVSESRGKAGTSHGCQATDPYENYYDGKRLKNALYEEIKNGSLLFQYTTREHATYENGINYYDHSVIIPRLEELDKTSFDIVEI